MNEPGRLPWGQLVGADGDRAPGPQQVSSKSPAMGKPEAAASSCSRDDSG